MLWKLNMAYFFVFCLFCFVLFFFACWLLQKLSDPVVEKPVSEDNKAPQTKYDVFVSFRGKDVRGNFLSHLIEIFKRNKINAFVDDKLKPGDEIWSSLVEAIEQSFILLIIFSQSYASSPWCLEELEAILECNKKYGRIVIPVFYQVEPADVRHQRGTYKNAFKKHEKRNKNKVQIWRHALKESANISGIETSKIRNEVELLQEIVRLVLERLGKSPINSKILIGIDEKIAYVELLIRKEPEATCLIGIWGMAGNGKTTLAEEVFKKLQSEYDGCYFLANEREQSSRHGIDSLKKEIFYGLLENVVTIDNPNVSLDIDRRIGRMKVLIVLDDVNDPDHLEKLLGTPDNFGSGSRIIITTRYVQVLNANKANEIYQLGEFSLDKALELFNLIAFKQSDHQWEYNELSKKVVDYAKGNPLVLKVLAQLLCGKNKEEWEGMLDTLKRMPPADVYKVMKLSYDELDRKEQQIFLDLACFFLRTHTTVNVSNLKSLLKGNESQETVTFRLGRLKDKALITYSDDNVIAMHDSLQEMALEIVRRESSEDPGSRSRLWDPNDIFEALKNVKSTKAIRSILIHLPTFMKQELDPHIFGKMNRLQFLEISGKCEKDIFDEHNILAKWLQFSASELRFLCWYRYPLKSLPEDFSAEKLVILKLPKGEIKYLWHGVKNLMNLKELHLTDSKMLEELPDLSNATNLEVLVLQGCSMLTRVHPSIFSLGKLEKLNLQDCTSLTTLASNSHLCSLSYLNLDKCEKLRKLSLIAENIKELRLRWTKVKAFSFTFGHESKLQLLLLEGSVIKKLPSYIKDLMQLSHLNVSYCSNLQEIPKLPPSLKILDARYCSSLQALEELPPSLKILDTRYCSSLQTLEELPSSLKILKVGYCKSLQTLQMLPRFLKSLTAQDCTSLKTVVFPSTATEQLKEYRKEVLFWNCLKLNQQSLEAIALNAQINVMKFANRRLSVSNHDDVENYNDYDKKYHFYQVVYVYPGSSVLEWLEYKTRNNYIIIDMSSAPPSLPVGFIFCFALGMYGDTSLERIEANITISDREGEGKKDSVGMYIGLRNGTIESDHLCVMYDQRCSAFLYSRAKNQKEFKIEVSMVLRSSSKEILTLPQQMFKGFGISLIDTLGFSSFKQQMELHDSLHV
ncbi:Disease resistance-like protein DSC1 [Glycine soja]